MKVKPQVPSDPVHIGTDINWDAVQRNLLALVCMPDPEVSSLYHSQQRPGLCASQGEPPIGCKAAEPESLLLCVQGLL